MRSPVPFSLGTAGGLGGCTSVLSDDDDNDSEWPAFWFRGLDIRSKCHLVSLFSGMVNQKLLISVCGTQPIFFKDI